MVCVLSNKLCVFYPQALAKKTPTNCRLALISHHMKLQVCLHVIFLQHLHCTEVPIINDKKTKSWQEDKTPSGKSTNTLYNPLIIDLICRLFARLFCRLFGSKWRQLSFCRSVVFLRRKDDKTPSEKTTKKIRSQLGSYVCRLFAIILSFSWLFVLSFRRLFVAKIR
jgi:hypothetical protein